MKRCPNCQRLNADTDILCVICSAALANAETVPDTDISEDWMKVCASRQERFSREAIIPSITYILAVGLLVEMWGGVPIGVLLPYMGSAGVVALAVGCGWAGPFRAVFLQTLFSGILVCNIGPFNPVMMLGHIVFSMLFGIWVETSADLR